MVYIISIAKSAFGGFDIYGDDAEQNYCSEKYIGYTKKNAIKKYREDHGLKGKHIFIYDETKEES